jgi:hypothetical protein
MSPALSDASPIVEAWRPREAAGDGRLFGSFSSEKDDSVLFLKKKNQKDFCFLAA